MAVEQPAHVCGYVERPEVLKGDFTYAESGVMDRTHLRFFTKKTMRDLFESCGYEVTAMRGVVPWREKRWLAAIAPPPSKDAVFRQFVLAARPFLDASSGGPALSSAAAQ